MIASELQKHITISKMRVWFLTFVILLLPRAQAQIFADVETSLGDFTIQLNHGASPRTVANFIRLAEGSSPWRDSVTGLLRQNTPFYDGLTFHRVIPNQICLTGSRDLTGTDDAGYSFPDEVSNGLNFDSPYLVAMTNEGPNSNGSEFFITRTTSGLSTLNGINTIFGSITSGQSVINTICATSTDSNNQPLNEITIDSVSIRRSGTSANSFNEFAQTLPLFSILEPNLDPTGPSLNFSQAPNTTAFVLDSTDLSNWNTTSRFHPADGATIPGFTPALTSSERNFFQVYALAWPETAFPPDAASILGNRIFRAEQSPFTSSFPRNPPVELRFEPNGLSGLWRSTAAFSSLRSFQLLNYNIISAYQIEFQIRISSGFVNTWTFQNVLLDEETNTGALGRTRMTVSDPSFDPRVTSSIDTTFSLIDR